MITFEKCSLSHSRRFLLSFTIFLATTLLFGVLLINCGENKESKDLKSTEVLLASDTLSSNGFKVLQDSTGYGAFCDSIKTLLGSLPTLGAVCTLASKIVQTIDSVKIANNSKALSDSKDSVAIAPLIMKGYETILAYRRLLSFGMPLSGIIPSLIRDTPINDSLSLHVLPKVGSSDFLSNAHFSFLGGGPFLLQQKQDNGKFFTDQQGKPELRFSCCVNENTIMMLNGIRHLKNSQINLEFGPPLSSYESGPQEVHGIGSLIHVFVNRIPVYFLTEDGFMPANLVSITQKLVPEGIGCVSDLPEVVFSCSSIPNKEILAVYIPYESERPTSCIVSRTQNVWVADLNNDGVPEFAGVSNTFQGVSSDTLSRVIWYVNVKGEWRIIDQAEELDCT